MCEWLFCCSRHALTVYCVAVDDMRACSLRTLDSHFKLYQEEGRVGRVELLPVQWHTALHGDATGVDRCGVYFRNVRVALTNFMCSVKVTEHVL